MNVKFVTPNHLKSGGRFGKTATVGLILLETTVFGFFASIPIGNLRIFLLNFSLFFYVLFRLFSNYFVELAYSSSIVSFTYLLLFIQKKVAPISSHTSIFTMLFEPDLFWICYFFTALFVGFTLSIKSALNYPSPYRKQGLFNHIKFKITRRLTFNWTFFLPFLFHNFTFLFFCALLRFLKPFLNLCSVLFFFKINSISLMLGLITSNFTLLVLMAVFIVTDAIIDYNLIEFPLQYPLYQSDSLSKYLTKSLEETVGKITNLCKNYSNSLVVTIPDASSKVLPKKKPEIYRFSVLADYFFYKFDLACFKMRYDYFYEKKEESDYNTAMKLQLNEKIKEINKNTNINLRYI
ncbi:hypothetical protein NUSPORA_00603 [Nucleospora cyclopteri]